MQGNIEILVTPARSAVGLNEQDRLALCTLMIKAGYRVYVDKRKPDGKTGYEYVVVLDKPKEV